MNLLPLLFSLFVATSAGAATITTGGPGVGTVLDLDVADFVAAGPCGTGGSVLGNRCSVVIKSNPDAPHAYGRYGPEAPPSSWVDSQDLSSVTWMITHDVAFTSLTFALTDAFDQGRDPILGDSFFRLQSGSAMWSIADREANGRRHWLTVAFDRPTTTANLNFFTRLNDGWGVSQATVATVPLPATGILLVAAIGALGLCKRRRRAALDPA